MLREILNTVRDAIAGLNLVSEIYMLADRVSDGTDTFPANYKGGGQFEPIKYDSTNGMIYIRKNGRPSFNEITDQSLKTTSCNDLLYRMVFPLRLVAFIDKSKAPCDDQYVDNYFALHLISALTNQRFQVGAGKVKFIATGFESDNLNVLREEYSNWKEIVDINYKYAYLSIDWNLEIIADVECLKECLTSDSQEEEHGFVLREDGGYVLREDGGRIKRNDP